MAQTEQKPENKKPALIKVRALEPLARVGYSHFEGDEFEISDELANVWLELKIIEVVKPEKKAKEAAE